MLLLRTLISLAVAVSALPFEKRSASSGGGVKLDFSVKPKNIISNTTLTLNTHDKRLQSIQLNNEGIGYYVDVTLGLQKTKISVPLDTGSSDLWVAGPNANVSADHTFDPSLSSTLQKTTNSFKVDYRDKSSASGPIVIDTVSFGDITVKGEFGVANSLSKAQAVFGIGMVDNEYSSGGSYPNIPVSLVQQGIISSNFYTLYLDSPESKTGSIIFGGTDDSKYTGPLTTLPLKSSKQFFVHLDTVGSYYVNSDVALDSGSTESVLPGASVLEIAKQFPNYQYDMNAGVYFFADSNIPEGNATFAFGATTISIPYRELVQELLDVHTNEPLGYLRLTIQEGSLFGDDPNNPSILGDNILRWVYAVFDLDKKTIQIAQAKFA